MHAQPSRTQGMALGFQSSTRVNHKLAPIGIIPPLHHLHCLILLAQSQGGVRDQLVRREAVMELNNANLVTALPRCEAGVGKDAVSAGLGHGVADDVHGRLAFKSGGPVGGEVLGDDFDGLVLEAVFVDKVFGGDDAGCGSILIVHRGMSLERGECKRRKTYGGRAAHELGEVPGDLGCVQDLFL